MAEDKDKRTSREGRSSGKQMGETSPNPHGPNKVIEMPIRTDQKSETRGKNVAQTPSTVGGQLNPSVAHDLGPRAGAGKNKSAPAGRQRKPAGSDAAVEKDVTEKEA